MNRAHATREAWHPQTKQDRETILRELDEVLASPHFCNSKRYPTLLKYIVENTLAGNLEVLKERTLGVEVFDRPPTYDTNTDTVVRYTAGEVRKRLLLYYSDRGHGSQVRISLPAGSYVAEFGHGQDESEDKIELQPGDPHEAEHGNRSSVTVREPALPSFAADSVAHAIPHGAGKPAHAGFRPSRVLWTVLLLAIVIAAVAGTWWKLRPAHSESSVDAFWAPVLRDEHTVIVCAGSSFFDPHNKSGVQTAGKDTDYPFVSMQTASAIAQVSSEMEHSGVATQLASAGTTALSDLREHSVTLLGGYNNQWTLRLVQPLRYYFVQGQGTEQIIADHAQPQTRWERDPSLAYSSADDYALVARFRDPTIDGWVVVLAGLGRNGTEAAAQFATSSHYLELLRDSVAAGPDSRNLGNRNIDTGNIEAVLKVSVIDGKTGAPSILAVHTW
jgi:hypothetical protein